MSYIRSKRRGLHMALRRLETPHFGPFCLSQSEKGLGVANRGLDSHITQWLLSTPFALSDPRKPVVVADQGVAPLLLPFTRNGKEVGRAVAPQYTPAIQLHADVCLTNGGPDGFTATGESHYCMLFIQMREFETRHQPQGRLLVVVMGEGAL